MYMPSPRPGVPNPYTFHNHVMNSRFFGSSSTRPVFGMPYAHQDSSNFMRHSLRGSSLGSLGDVNVGNGVFRPKGDGGGVFNDYLSGYGALGADDSCMTALKACDPGKAATLGQAIATATAAMAQAVTNPSAMQAITTQLNVLAAGVCKAATDCAAKKKGGGAQFITPSNLPAGPLPDYQSGGMSDSAKYALYGGGAALVAALGYYFYSKKR